MGRAYHVDTRMTWGFVWVHIFSSEAEPNSRTLVDFLGVESGFGLEERAGMAGERPC